MLRPPRSLSITVVTELPEEAALLWIAPIRESAGEVKLEAKGSPLLMIFSFQVDDDDASTEWAFPIVEWFAKSDHLDTSELRFDPQLNSRERANLHHLVEKDSRLAAFSQGQGSARYLTIKAASASFVKPTLSPTTSEQAIIDAIRDRLMDAGKQGPGISEFLSLLRAPGGLESSAPHLHEIWLESQRRVQVSKDLTRACSKGNLEETTRIVSDNRWALFTTRRSIRSPLCSAIVGGHVEIARFLLAQGVPASSFCSVERATMVDLARRCPADVRVGMVALFEG